MMKMQIEYLKKLEQEREDVGADSMVSDGEV